MKPERARRVCLGLSLWPPARRSSVERIGNKRSPKEELSYLINCSKLTRLPLSLSNPFSLSLSPCVFNIRMVLKKFSQPSRYRVTVIFADNLINWQKVTSHLIYERRQSPNFSSLQQRSGAIKLPFFCFVFYCDNISFD